MRRMNVRDVGVSECFTASYAALSDSVLASWTRTFVQEGIEGDPFAMMIYLIDHYSSMPQTRHDTCMSLDDISSGGQTNVWSSAIATCALIRKMGWDLLCFYNDDEIYLGIYFSEDWKIMGGYRIEDDDRTYFLKAFDMESPVGLLGDKEPTYFSQCAEGAETDLKPFPLVHSLPWFDGEYRERTLRWQYQDRSYAYVLRIPEQQVLWAGNLPPSLYGMGASGILEVQQTGLPGYLQQSARNLSEYDRVNFLLKFCQSEGVFHYESDDFTKSVSTQLQEGHNDCDSRSIFLYCLLRTVMNYADDDIVFAVWPDEQHCALSVRPRTDEAREVLKEGGYSTGDGFYLLDPTNMGDTYWGSKNDEMPETAEIITR